MAKKHKPLNFDRAIDWLEDQQMELPPIMEDYTTPQAATLLNCNYTTVETLAYVGLLNSKRRIHYPYHSKRRRYSEKGDIIIPHPSLIHFLRERSRGIFALEIEEAVFKEGLIRTVDLAESLEGEDYDVLYILKTEDLANFNISASQNPAKPYYRLPRLMTKTELEKIRDERKRDERKF